MSATFRSWNVSPRPCSTAFPRLVLDLSRLGRRRIRVEAVQPPRLGPPVPGERVPVGDAHVHLWTGNEEFNLRTDAEGYARVPEQAIGHALEITASDSVHPNAVANVSGRQVPAVA